MSDTPRTDAAECEAIAGLGRCVGANFARELERELAAAVSERNRLHAECENLIAVNAHKENVNDVLRYELQSLRSRVAHLVIAIT